jgi:hypothetical protein
MNTRTDAAPLLGNATVVAGYATTAALVVVVALAISTAWVYEYRLQKRRNRQLHVDLSQAVWPSAEFPERNVRLATALRRAKSKDLTPVLAAELERRESAHEPPASDS